jgi:hypothetical protein
MPNPAITIGVQLRHAGLALDDLELARVRGRAQVGRHRLKKTGVSVTRCFVKKPAQNGAY